MSDPTVDSLLSVAGATPVVTIAVEAIKRAWAPSKAELQRFGPLVSIGVGLVLVGSAAVAVGASIPQALLTGLLAGAAAIGLHQLVTR